MSPKYDNPHLDLLSMLSEIFMLVQVVTFGADNLSSCKYTFKRHARDPRTSMNHSREPLPSPTAFTYVVHKWSGKSQNHGCKSMLLRPSESNKEPWFANTSKIRLYKILLRSLLT